MRTSEHTANRALQARITQGWIVGANFHKPSPARIPARRVSLFARILRALIGK